MRTLKQSNQLLSRKKWPVHPVLFSVFIIIILAFFSSLSFFDGNKLIIGLDEWSVLRPSFRLNNWFYTWDSYSSLGRDLSSRIVNLPMLVLPYYLMEKSGMTLVASQRIFYCFIFFLSGISMYYLSLVLWPKKHLLALTAALIYMFNPVVGGYWASLLVPAIFDLAVAPLIIAVFIKGLKSGDKMGSAIWFSFSTILYPMVNPPLFVIVGIILFGFWIYFSAVDQKFRSNTFFAVICLILFLLVNSWWGINLFKSFLGSSDFMESGDSINRLSSNSLTSSFLNLFRFQTNYWGFSYWGDKVNNYVGYLLETNLFMLAGSFLLITLAYVALLLTRGSSLVLLLSILSLIFIFLSKGAHSPFGIFYEKLFELPLFNMFRTPAHKFPTGTIILVSLMAGASIWEIYQRLKKRSVIWATLSTCLILLLILSNQWYFFTGDVLQRGKSAQPPVLVQFPTYYWEAADWLSKQNDFFRIISVPGADIPTLWANYSWGFLGLYSVPSELFRRPIVDKLPLNAFPDFRWGVYALLGNFKGLPPGYSRLSPTENIAKLLKLMSVRYLLVNKDYDWQNEFYGMENPELLSASVKKQKGINLEKSFGSLDFYIVADPLPIIYTTSSTQEIVGDNLAFPIIADFPDWYPEKGSLLNKDLLADQIFIIPKLTNGVSDWEMKVNRSTSKIDFPFSRWSPGSFLYRLVLKKEDQQKESAQSWQEEFELNLFFATKRVHEIQRWGTILSDGDFEATLERYQDEMSSAINLLKDVRIRNVDHLVSKMEGMLEIHEVRLMEVAETLNDIRKKQVFNSLNNLYKKSDGDLGEIDHSDKKYIFDVPQEGEYKIFLRKESGFDRVVKTRLIINDQIKEAKVNGSDWIAVGKENLARGQNHLVFNSVVSNNLLEGSNPEMKTIIGKRYACQQVTAYPNTLYQVRFAYQAGFENNEILVSETDLSGKANILFQKRLWGDGLTSRNYHAIFRSSPFAKDLFLCNSDKGDGSFKLSDVQVVKISEPILLLRLSKPSEKRLEPALNYEKIDPTRYKVQISHAKNPYVLVFSETYAPGWQAKINNRIIPPDRHLAINGFANSWLINPQDTNNQEDYEIILEYAAQRWQYIGVGISVLTVTLAILYLVIKRRKIAYEKI